MATPMFPLAVTTEMFWRDVPYLERVRRISDLGFQVEMWDWTVKDLPAVAALGAAELELFKELLALDDNDLLDLIMERMPLSDQRLAPVLCMLQTV